MCVTIENYCLKISLYNAKKNITTARLKMYFNRILVSSYELIVMCNIVIKYLN